MTRNAASMMMQIDTDDPNTPEFRNQPGGVNTKQNDTSPHMGN
jgi:hypothetical protein